jgi:hypothetical protein
MAEGFLLADQSNDYDRKFELSAVLSNPSAGCFSNEHENYLV